MLQNYYICGLVQERSLLVTFGQMSMTCFIFHKDLYYIIKLTSNKVSVDLRCMNKLLLIITSIEEKRKSGFDYLLENINYKSMFKWIQALQKGKTPKRLIYGEKWFYFKTAMTNRGHNYLKW